MLALIVLYVVLAECGPRQSHDYPDRGNQGKAICKVLVYLTNTKLQIPNTKVFVTLICECLAGEANGTCTHISTLKSIHVHLSPGSSCGLVVYTLRILAQRYTFFMGHTAIF